MTTISTAPRAFSALNFPEYLLSLVRLLAREAAQSDFVKDRASQSEEAHND